LLALILLLLLVPPQAGTPARPAAADTARALQQKYDQVKDFTADFTHDYKGGVLKKQSLEHGTVQIKKPGRMRWDYAAPDRKLFVSDGRKVYSYIPADKQVIVSDIPAEDEATTAVLFLAGKGNLTRDFTVTYAAAADLPGADAPDVYALRLAPRQKQRDYDWLVIVVDRGTLRIRSLTAADQQGGRSSFTFTNYRENAGVADKAFEFKIPRGVDVITAGAR
jgi:outer membrane lipoprotein carrier protein